jgi:hypothetical protein
MEAMSVEKLLLSIWEEEGFVGKTRVAVGPSDVDALAVKPTEGVVRIGEAKVREGCTLVYPVDQEHLVEMAKDGEDFQWWLGAGWSSWLDNLPRLWEPSGTPTVPWLLPASELTRIDVTFLCNLWVFGDAAEADDAMKRTSIRHLRQNPAISTALDNGSLTVTGRVLPTASAIEDLLRVVVSRVWEDGYTRRFGDPVKDVLRELNRYVNPFVKRIPRDGDGVRIDTRRQEFQLKVRRATVLGLLDALGVSPEELTEMLSE